jgi:serine/threonine-protein kinase
MKKIIKNSLITILFIITGALAAYVTFVLLTSTKNHEVPVLAGKSILDANKLLSEKKLFLKIEGESYDADVPAGYIIRQVIPAGNKIKEGRTIGVIISKGPKILYIPILSGLTLDDAEELIQQNNIKVDRIIKVHSPTVEKNKVIAQDPNPEEQGAGGITLIVSMGNYDDILVCPSFTGMAAEDAKNLARQIGLETTMTGEGNKVGSQSPPAQSLVKKGDAVRLELKETSEFKWWF